MFTMDNDDKLKMREITASILRGFLIHGSDGEHIVIGMLAGVREFVEEQFTGDLGQNRKEMQEELTRLANMFKD